MSQSDNSVRSYKVCVGGGGSNISPINIYRKMKFGLKGALRIITSFGQLYREICVVTRRFISVIMRLPSLLEKAN